MTGATIITLENGSATGAAMPFVVGALSTLVAYGRWSLLKPTTADGGAPDFSAEASV